MSDKGRQAVVKHSINCQLTAIKQGRTDNSARRTKFADNGLIVGGQHAAGLQ
jgi:hypothetical protein